MSLLNVADWLNRDLIRASIYGHGNWKEPGGIWRGAEMAIAIAGDSVVGRKDHIDDIYPGGVDLCIEPYCEWLQEKQWNKGVIAWLTGTVPKAMIAREGWTPEIGSGLVFAESSNNPNLKFLRVEGNLADEAVQVGEKAAALKPDNSETLGNLACAYLFAVAAR